MWMTDKSTFHPPPKLNRTSVSLPKYLLESNSPVKKSSIFRSFRKNMTAINFYIVNKKKYRK